MRTAYRRRGFLRDKPALDIVATAIAQQMNNRRLEYGLADFNPLAAAVQRNIADRELLELDRRVTRAFAQLQVGKADIAIAQRVTWCAVFQRKGEGAVGIGVQAVQPQPGIGLQHRGDIVAQCTGIEVFQSEGPVAAHLLQRQAAIDRQLLVTVGADMQPDRCRRGRSTVQPGQVE